MAIVGRALDSSEQLKQWGFKVEIPVTTGATGVLHHIPFNCQLSAIQGTAMDVTSNANLLLNVSRFIPGVGLTVWNIGSTFVPPVFGTSGYPASGISLPVFGSTLGLLMANDVLGYVGGGGSTAAIYSFVGSIVVKPMQDLKVYLGGLA